MKYILLFGILFAFLICGNTKEGKEVNRSKVDIQKFIKSENEKQKEVLINK